MAEQEIKRCKKEADTSGCLPTSTLLSLLKSRTLDFCFFVSLAPCCKDQAFYSLASPAYFMGRHGHVTECSANGLSVQLSDCASKECP